MLAATIGLVAFSVFQGKNARELSFFTSGVLARLLKMAVDTLFTSGTTRVQVVISISNAGSMSICYGVES
jgi:hypothetical protein